MDVILLERIAKLGQMGDVVRVKDGFARNFLLPQGKALRANENSKARFDKMKVELEARNLQNRSEAEKVGKKIDGKTFTVLRQAAEGGQLYGSVSPRDIATLVSEKGFAVSRSQIALHVPIKAVGKHAVPITLHPEVDVAITIIVARNADEAGRIERGENILTARDEDREADAQAAAIAAEAAAAFFEPDGPDSRRDREQAPEAEDDTGDARKPARP